MLYFIEIIMVYLVATHERYRLGILSWCICGRLDDELITVISTSDFDHWLLMSNRIQNKHNYLICSSTWRVLDHVMHIDALLWTSDNLALICRNVTSDNIINTATIMISRMSLYCPALILTFLAVHTNCLKLLFSVCHKHVSIFSQL